MKSKVMLKDCSVPRPLEECADLRSGKTPTRSRAEFWGGNVPWYSAKDLKSFRLEDSTEHISDQAVANGAPIAKHGELLILVRGMTLMKDVPIGLLECDASFNQDIKALKPRDDINSEYLGYMLTASRPRLMAMVEQAGHGTGRLAIERLVSLPVWVPAVDIQDFIVKRLQRLEEVLEKQQLLIQAKQTFKRGLMQQLLTGQKRFPEYRDSEWIDVHLGDVFEERVERNRPDLPLLSVTNDRGIIPRDALAKRDTSNPDKSKYKRVAVGDIAYNTMRMWQGVSALSALEGIISPAYTVAVPTGRICGHFAKHLFKYPPVVNLFHRYSQGLVDDTLNLKFDKFSKIKLKIPEDTEEQSRIGAFLDLCDAQLDLIAAQRSQIDLQKRWVLARILSGELEVPCLS